MPPSNHRTQAEETVRTSESACEAERVRSAVGAVRRGDQDAFAPLVELFQKRLFGLCLMVTRSQTGAEEVTQAAFIRAFLNLHLYDERRAFYPWLATIGFRLAQNWLQKQSLVSRREGVELSSDLDPAHHASSLDALIADQRVCPKCQSELDETRAIEASLGGLPGIEPPSDMAASIMKGMAERAASERVLKSEVAVSLSAPGWDLGAGVSMLAGTLLGVGGYGYLLLSGELRQDLTSIRMGPMEGWGLASQVDPAALVVTAGLLMFLAGLFALQHGTGG